MNKFKITFKGLIITNFNIGGKAYRYYYKLNLIYQRKYQAYIYFHLKRGWPTTFSDIEERDYQRYLSFGKRKGLIK